MSEDEKKALLVILMEDIRGNWGWEKKSRVSRLHELATELEILQVLDRVNEYINLCSEGEDDGRYFRVDFKYGGYENPPFKINRDFNSYSDEFKKEALGYLTYPSRRFENFEEVNNA